MKRLSLLLSLILGIIMFSFGQSPINFTPVTNNLQGVGFSSAIWFDVNNDGLKDLLYFGTDTSYQSYYTFLLVNQGNDSFTVYNSSDINIPELAIGSVDTADFNGDGYTDLIIQGATIDANGHADIYYNNGDLTFSPANLGLLDFYYGSVAACDYNNDGNVDFAIAGFETDSNSYHCFIYKNTGSSFVKLDDSLPGVMYGVLRWGDYNNDNLPDLLITGFESINTYSPYAKIWKNLGNDHFQETQIALYPNWIGDAQWFDYNGDGNLDLFLTGVGGESGDWRRAILYENTGDSLVQVDTFKGVSHSSVEIADFDNDGDLDVFYNGLFGAGMGTGEYLTKILFNDNGQFYDTLSLELTGIYWGDCRAADYNNDGKVDLFLNGFYSKNDTDVAMAAVYKQTEATSVINLLSNGLKISPNPATDYLIVQGGKAITRYSITDISGRQVMQGNLSQKKIDVRGLKPGTYIITLQGNGIRLSQKFIKQ